MIKNFNDKCNLIFIYYKQEASEYKAGYVDARTGARFLAVLEKDI